MIIQIRVFFTVIMSNLQDEDTGAYWCAVEIEGIRLDVTEQLHLTVQSVPDVSVVNSSVSGHEGGNISVQCFYSSGYKNKVKQWCRYKDQSCYTVGRPNTSQNSSVQISDDGRSSFTVLMTGLRLTDSGWYFCSVGKQEAPVQLNVTEDPQVSALTVTESKPAAVTTEGFERNRDATTLSSTKPVSVNTNQTGSSGEQQNDHRGYLEVCIPTSVLLMVIVTVVSAIILRNKCKRNEYFTEVNRDGASDAGNSASSSSAVAENDVTYTSVIVQPKAKASSPVSVEDEVTYTALCTNR